MTLSAARTAPVVRVARDGLAVIGLLIGAYLFVVVAPVAKTVGFDAFSYWSVNLTAPYFGATGALGPFLYSPVAARLFAADGGAAGDGGAGCTCWRFRPSRSSSITAMCTS